MSCPKCGFSNSPTAKFCKQCGMGLPRNQDAAAQSAAAAAPAATVAQSAPSTFATGAPAAAAADFAAQARANGSEPAIATSGSSQCPQCGTSRVAGKRFCRQCRFDFATLDTKPQTLDAAPAQHQTSAPAQTVSHESDRAVHVAPEPALATMESAAQDAVADALTNGADVAARPSSVAMHEAEPEPATDTSALAIASDADAIQTCPQCATGRTPGKRFCRTCRFDYAVQQPANETVAAAAEETVAMPPDADEASLASTSPAAPTETSPPPRETRFAAGTATAATTANTTPPDVAPVGSPERAAEQAVHAELHANDTAQAAQKSVGKKAWVFGGAAVVVVGIAIGVGLLMRSHRAPPSTDDASAGATAAASASPSVVPDSPGSQALAKAPVGASSGTVSDAGTVATQSLAASETGAASEDAPVKQTTSPSDTTVSAPAPAQAQPQPQAQAAPQASSPMPAQPAAQEPAPSAPMPAQPAAQEPAPSAPMPAQTAAQEPAPSAPRVHDKPKKATAPADTAPGENATIRTAIAGSLSDGASCFANKKFDCAISDTDAVLRLDPHNAQALSLRKRAKAAQQSALNSMSIE